MMSSVFAVSEKVICGCHLSRAFASEEETVRAGGVEMGRWRCLLVSGVASNFSVKPPVTGQIVAAGDHNNTFK